LKKEDSADYLKKKALFESMITLYGRNVVVEVLEDESIKIHKLHLSTSNRDDGVINTIKTIANRRNIEIKYHDKAAISRISKNASQDQGVAIDIVAPNYKSVDNFLQNAPQNFRILALDGIHNPQNLGMIIRSAAAGNIDAIILPKKNSVKISPLVIKASAGTLFKIDILFCDKLEDVLGKFEDTQIYMLSSHAKDTLLDLQESKKSIFVLGNESDGVSLEVEAICNTSVKIEMNRGVESLNVAITAALIAFK
jgi:23S rRNA (guanosine2251-2'-O)-methyltransferase